jgi:hypothetical protein
MVTIKKVLLTVGVSSRIGNRPLNEDTFVAAAFAWNGDTNQGRASYEEIHGQRQLSAKHFEAAEKHCNEDYADTDAFLKTEQKNQNFTKTLMFGISSCQNMAI